MNPETAIIGDTLPSFERAMTQQIIDAWSEVSGDRNPLHVDPEFARTTRFRGTIAHGHIALSYLCQLMQGWAGIQWMRGGHLADVRFLAPIQPGKSYRIGGEVEAISDAEVAVKLYIRETGDGHDCVEGNAICPRERAA